MSRGGAREGAGAKRGSKRRRTAEFESARARLRELGHDPVALAVAMAQDETLSPEIRLKANADLIRVSYAPPRAEQQRRPIRIEGDTLEAKGRNVFAALGNGDLSPDEAGMLLQGVERLSAMEKFGLVADCVARLMVDRGLPLPAELEVRRRIPATLVRGSS